jgi:hypothetical protein
MGLFSKSKAEKETKPTVQAVTSVVLPLRDVHQLDTATFSRRFREIWGDKIAISEAKSQSLGSRKYELGRGSEKLTLTVESNPLPRGLAEVSITAAKSSALPNELTSSEEKEFLDNVGHMTMMNQISQNNGPAQSAFLSEALITLMKQVDSAVGYNVLSAQMYRTRAWLDSMLSGTPGMDPALMFVLLGNIHAVRNGKFWIHTHGMEQFGVPDIEVEFDDESKRSYFTELIGDAAMYTAENGPILKVGDTAELAGDGVMYRIGEAVVDPEHPFGRFGAIRITKI